MLVCKLFAEEGTPLFPNDPDAESRALLHLDGTGLAPDHISRITSRAGAVLVYRHIPGPVWTSGVDAVADLLSRLHAAPPPAGLRRIAPPLSTTGMIPDDGSAEARRLARMRPDFDVAPNAEMVFLHGDVVAENIIASPAGLRLIDWQCPALGDPTEDLAIFLSPAMQYVYGRRRLSATDEADFLNGYGHRDRVQRYRVLAPAFHWRMACYCLWKARRGDADYMEGFRREIARLEDLR